jgi:hypothetical protein
LAFLYLPDLCSNTHIVQLNQVFYEIVYFFYLLNSFRVQPFWAETIAAVESHTFLGISTKDRTMSAAWHLSQVRRLSGDKVFAIWRLWFRAVLAEHGLNLVINGAFSWSVLVNLFLQLRDLSVHLSSSIAAQCDNRLHIALSLMICQCLNNPLFKAFVIDKDFIWDGAELVNNRKQISISKLSLVLQFNYVVKFISGDVAVAVFVDLLYQVHDISNFVVLCNHRYEVIFWNRQFLFILWITVELCSSYIAHHIIRLV